ncbi:flagellar biosynthetic protein FliO [Paenibacillus soyae]|uniref:Flagellar biosynthetic protein FliO n=1 Tax=Paenibacillus soyae TaxID=2969249 RepID=A0A9X2MSG6_9BACL|nr:flagellar biosynthetic protein FliO [Paenibacillus soyae]MCR2805023.1 flagellar biosynthetic protein FliO [Paenibacillus soyae]
MKNLRMHAAFLSTIGFAALPTYAAADSSGSGVLEEEIPPIPASSPGELIGNLVWVMVALALVVALILFAIKWLSKRNQLWGGNRSMRSLGGIALGQNSSLQVVDIGGRVYIVGVGQQITLLDKLSDPDEAAELIASLEQQGESTWSPKDFASFVQKWRNRHSTSASDAQDNWNGQSSFQQMLQSKLSKHSDRKQQLESMLQDDNTNERLMDHEKK